MEECQTQSKLLEARTDALRSCCTPLLEALHIRECALADKNILPCMTFDDLVRAKPSHIKCKFSTVIEKVIFCFILAGDSNCIENISAELSCFDNRRLAYMMLLHDIWSDHDFVLCMPQAGFRQLSWSEILQQIYAVSAIDFDAISSSASFKMLFWDAKSTERPSIYIDRFAYYKAVAF